MLDVDRQLQRQLCQASGGMAGDSSEAVAACAAHLRWIEAAAKSAPKTCSKEQKWALEAHGCNLFPSRDPHSDEVGSIRPRGA